MDTYKNSFFVRTSKDWKKLDNAIVNAPHWTVSKELWQHSITHRVYIKLGICRVLTCQINVQKV